MRIKIVTKTQQMTFAIKNTTTNNNPIYIFIFIYNAMCRD